MSRKSFRNRLDLSRPFSNSAAFLSVLFALGCAVQTQGQTMSNLNSMATVNPLNQSGMNSWTINGQQEMTQQWFWYSLGPVGVSTPPASIDTLALSVQSQPTANTLDLSFLGPGFTISVDYTLTGSAPGVYKSDMGEAISIQNNTSSPLLMEFYKYQDFNLQNGQGGSNTVNIYGNPLGYNSAVQTSALMTALSDIVLAPGSQEAEASTEFLTRNRLNNGVGPVILNNVTTAGPGNVTSAFEWDLNIGPGGTALISEDDLVESSSMIPEPSVLALIPAGFALLALAKRRLRA